MAAISVSPAKSLVGRPVVVLGDDFLPSALVTVEIPELGIQSEILTDGAGGFGTDDIADRATTTLTSTGANPANNSTVVVGSVTYTLKTTLASVANQVQIGADAAETLANLKKAINLTGTPDLEYGAGTAINPDAVAGTLTPTTLFMYAKVGGTAGNSLASTESSPTTSFPGATFSGGSDATGISPIILAPEKPGSYLIRASDGVSSVEAIASVWSA